MAIGLLLPLTAIATGLVGAASFLVERIPSMKPTIEKLAIYQAGIGAAGAIIGLLQSMDIIFGSSVKGSLWLAGTLTCVACVVVGLVLGYPLIQKLILDDLSEESRTKAANFRNALAPFQVLGGIVALGGGIYCLLGWIAGGR